MRRVTGVVGAATLVGVGLGSALLVSACGGGQAAAKVSTALSSASVTRATSAPAQTVTEQAPAPPPSTVTQVATVTTAPAATPTLTVATTVATIQPQSTSSDPSVWAWVLLGAGGVAVVFLIVRLVRRRPELSADERQQRLFAAVTGWTTRGWTIDRQSTDSAELSRDGNHVRLTVDARGQVASSRLVAG